MRTGIFALAILGFLGGGSIAAADDIGHATPGSPESAHHQGAGGTSAAHSISGESTGQGEGRASAPDGSMNANPATPPK